MAYLVTGALITSELIFIADYRTLGLSHPRINEPSDYRYITQTKTFRLCLSSVKEFPQ